MGKSLKLSYANEVKLSKTVGVVHKKCVYLRSPPASFERVID